MTAPLLEVSNLSVTFPGATVVDDVSFTIERGATLGVVGESGSGKSMTALGIIGLLPAAAQVTGSVLFDGQQLLGADKRLLRRIRGDRIAMVFQDPLSSLNPYYTVGFQIAEAFMAHRKVSRGEARRAAVDAMDKVHIPDAARRYDQYPHQFSGGMRQRVMIAMALICGPDLVIADEPTTALDVTVQARILELLDELQQLTGAGMLFITHDLAVVSQVADDVLVMQEGRALEYGTAERVFSAPEHEYTERLLDATPRLSGGAS